MVWEWTNGLISFTIPRYWPVQTTPRVRQMVLNKTSTKESPPPALSPVSSAPSTGQSRGFWAAAIVAFARRNQVALISTLLFGLTVWAFLPSLGGQFLYFDEHWYVQDSHIKSGLNWENFCWAWSSVVSSNWHPLTVLSHMLDCQIYGLTPWGHHLTNVLIHALNTMLLFLAWRNITGATWRSLAVAALFGFHPLRVESVAWISERKDVLSGLFWILTIWSYARYVKCTDGRRVDGSFAATESQPSATFVRPLLLYALTLLFFACGLMSKPMVVTLPFVLLLLDYWPLGRLSGISPLPNPGVRNALIPILDKLPFFLLAAVVSRVTYLVQGDAGTMFEWANLPVTARLGNALVSYARYLGKFFWPVDLCTLYPHPGNWDAAKVGLAFAFVLAISALALLLRRRSPWLLTGWFWYLGTLVPAIGLIQVGSQSIADRYTYIPLIGIYVMLAWGIEALARRRSQVIVMSAANAGVVLVCIGLTRHQIGFWKDDTAVWRRAISVTKNNYAAHNNLGDVLSDQGRYEDALIEFQETVRLRPDFAEGEFDLAKNLRRLGRLPEAIDHYRKSLALRSDNMAAELNLANALLDSGNLNEAAESFRKVLASLPRNISANNGLAATLYQMGRVDEAIAQYESTLKMDPDEWVAHCNLGSLLTQKGQVDEAILHLQKAVQIRPQVAEPHNSLGLALSSKGRVQEAANEFEAAVKLKPEWAEPHNNLGELLARQGQLDEATAELETALKLRPSYARAHNTLGSVLFKEGKLDEAIEQFREAVALNPAFSQAQSNLETALRAKEKAAGQEGH